MPTPEATEKALPQNLEAERSLLASMLLDNDCIGVVAQSVKKEHFFAPENRHIYDAILELYGKNRAADLVTVSDTLRRRGLYEAIGGAGYLASVATSSSSGVNAEHYATIVHNKAIRRQLIEAHMQALAEVQSSAEEEDALLDRSQHLIFKVAEEHEIGHTVAIGDLLRATMRKIEGIHDRHNRLTGVPTGFMELDNLTSGLQDGELIVLAARPSVGKTALARTITETVGLREGKAVAFFSMEMSQEQIVLNMLCSCAKINAHDMRRGMLRDESWAELVEAADRLCETRIFIDDTPALSPMQLRAKARRLKMQEKIDLVVVDYLQLMSSPVMENRQQQIAEISRSLKALARDLSVPIVALSQLNRAVDRESREPMLHDLRESGAIEQDADVVLLLHRDDYQQRDESATPIQGPSVAKLIVAKQRNGPTGALKLTFLRQFIRFENYIEWDGQGVPEGSEVSLPRGGDDLS
ncbi:MAG: replicative DNA helicase [Planctomycetota bacterium]